MTIDPAVQAQITKIQTDVGVVSADLATLQSMLNAPAPAPVPSIMAPPVGYTSAKLIWEESFAVYDSARWYQDLRDIGGRWDAAGRLPAPYSGSNPGSYNAEYYDPAQLAYGSSGITITAVPDSKFAGLGYSWKSGALSTGTKWRTPAAGCYMQFRAKMPDMGHGAWPAFWYYFGGGGTEIDLYEGSFLLSGAPINSVMSSTLHLSPQIELQFNTGVDLSADWHTYGIEYKPGVSIKCYMDGVLKAVFTTKVPTGQYPILIDLAMGQNRSWGTVSDIVNHPGPYQMHIKELQVYSL